MKQKLNDKRKKARKKILLDSLMVFFIIISPFIFKLHEYVSSDPEATLDFLGISISKNGFPNINVYIWFLLGKIVPLYLLLIWFFTCKHWWYHIILIPMLMYTFQIFEGVVSEDNYIDTENVMWLLPVCMIIIPIVYFIRIKLYDKYVHGIDLEAMDAELESLNKFRTSNGNSETDAEQSTSDPEGNEPTIGYQSFSDYLNSTLSTNNIERKFRQFQNNLKGWLHLKF